MACHGGFTPAFAPIGYGAKPQRRLPTATALQPITTGTGAAGPAQSMPPPEQTSCNVCCSFRPSTSQWALYSAPPALARRLPAAAAGPSQWHLRRAHAKVLAPALDAAALGLCGLQKKQKGVAVPPLRETEGAAERSGLFLLAARSSSQSHKAKAQQSQ